MIFGDEGATAIAPTARSLIESVSGVQVLPSSVVFQTPPSAVPRYIVPAIVGSVAIAVARPAPFVGPSEPHVFPATPSLDSPRCLALRAWYSRLTIGNRSDGSILPLSPCRLR